MQSVVGSQTAKEWRQKDFDYAIFTTSIVNRYHLVAQTKPGAYQKQLAVYHDIQSHYTPIYLTPQAALLTKETLEVADWNMLTPNSTYTMAHTS